MFPCGRKLFCLPNSTTLARFHDLTPLALLFRQEDEVGLYVGLARCLSEMSDTEIERITRVTEVRAPKQRFPRR